MFQTIVNYDNVPLSELVVLHLWALPVIVSRLLSAALLLTVHPYWTLVGGALHLVLRGVYRCRTVGVPRTVADVMYMCLDTLHFFITSLLVAMSITVCTTPSISWGNTAAIVVWALGTPLMCTHPTLYTAIICFNAVMFAVGQVSMELHEKYWPHSYLKYKD